MHPCCHLPGEPPHAGRCPGVRPDTQSHPSLPPLLLVQASADAAWTRAVPFISFRLF